MRVHLFISYLDFEHPWPIVKDVYVLTDSAFPFLCRIEPSQQYNPIVEMILAFPCGLLRGALSSLGLCCIVNADVINLPSCQFTVRVLPRSKSSGM
uniref:Trafficking protein particle complex subunit 6B n=1 Tax=Mesocestoides corti TaxID=53468 RepID=A0A5K3F3N8_MESCO